MERRRTKPVAATVPLGLPRLWLSRATEALKRPLYSTRSRHHSALMATVRRDRSDAAAPKTREADVTSLEGQSPLIGFLGLQTPVCKPRDSSK